MSESCVRQLRVIELRVIWVLSRVGCLLCYEDVEERREELTEQFAELQKRLKAQALEHNIIRHELQQARSELEAIIVNSK